MPWAWSSPSRPKEGRLAVRQPAVAKEITALKECPCFDTKELKGPVEIELAAPSANVALGVTGRPAYQAALEGLLAPLLAAQTLAANTPSTAPIQQNSLATRQGQNATVGKRV